ncbi:MAG: hypothetical protein ACP5PJ_07155, partial [Acidimicrobiales bacterium]
SPTGKGYWLVASDGGIFTFGDAHFYGSLPGLAVNEAVAGASPTPDGGGYDELLANGQIVSFGDGSSSGDVTTMGAAPIGTPIAMVTPGAS